MESNIKAFLEMLDSDIKSGKYEQDIKKGSYTNEYIDILNKIIFLGGKMQRINYKIAKKEAKNA